MHVFGGRVEGHAWLQVWMEQMINNWLILAKTVEEFFVPFLQPFCEYEI